MENVWVNGFIATLIINLSKVIIATSRLHSIRSKNFAKIELYYQCSTGNYVEEDGSALKYIGYLFYMLIVAPMGSWLSVASAAAFPLINYFRAPPAIAQIKEAYFKLGVSLLPEREVRRLALQLREFASGRPVAINEIVLSSAKDDSREIMKIFPSKRQLKCREVTEDRLSHTERVLEYRLLNLTIQVRLLLLTIEDAGSAKQTPVLDGVVQEQSVRQDFPKFRDVEEALEGLRIQTTWQPLTQNRIVYEVLSVHVTEIGETEWRRFMRNEVNRLTMGSEKMRAAAEHLQLKVVECGEGVNFEYADAVQENERTSVADAMVKACEDLEVTPWELAEYKTLCALLQVKLADA